MRNFCTRRKMLRNCGRTAMAVMLLIIVYYTYQIYNDREIMVFLNTWSATPCVLPDLDPFDTKMMEYVWKLNPIVCDRPPVVFVDFDNTLKYNVSAIKLLNENPGNVNCDISSIKRVLDMDVTFTDFKPWNPPQPLPWDHFRIKCKGSKGILFDNTMTRIQKKNETFQQLSDALTEDKYNVMMFGMDSLSRSSAIRQLPNTVKFLQTLGGYDMKGYTKVGDNSFANIAPLLAGLYAEEITNIDYRKHHLDQIPLIWKNFSQQKAVTMFAEDFPMLGMFNMDRNGFLNPPTDHYMRPFWLASSKIMPMHKFRKHMARMLEQKNMNFGKTSALCLADKPNHVVVMHYLKQFMLTYREHRKFSFSFLTELSHEFQNLLQLGDDDIRNFFKWLSDEGFLNDTILIMFSDHGLKFGNNQHLFVARTENRMPLLNIVLPERLKRKYPKLDKILRTNQARLTSTFDLHATLRAILTGNFNETHSYNVNGKKRGVSLFTEIPSDRTCADASIVEEFCACYKSTSLNVTNNKALASRIAVLVIAHINNMLRQYPRCVLLTLDKIIELSKIEQGLKLIRTASKHNLWITNMKKTQVEKREDTRYTIVLETVPGHARFFATCDVIDNSVNVFGNVDRVNRYGNQSYCVDRHELKPLCFCADYSDE